MQTLSFAAPSILQEWGVSRAEFGFVLTAHLLGYLVGAVFLTFYGDRLGRKNIILAGATIFSVFTFAAGIDEDLAVRICPIEEVLERLDPLLSVPIRLSEEEFHDLLAFLREGLLDPRAEPAHLEKLIPASLPSGLPPLIFERRGQ